nr:MAG TPA: hypothetical protein [Caudoviricetes sp.]
MRPNFIIKKLCFYWGKFYIQRILVTLFYSKAPTSCVTINKYRNQRITTAKLPYSTDRKRELIYHTLVSVNILLKRFTDIILNHAVLLKRNFTSINKIDKLFFCQNNYAIIAGFLNFPPPFVLSYTKEKQTFSNIRLNINTIFFCKST